MRHEPTSGYEDPALNYLVSYTSYDNGEIVRHEEVIKFRDTAWDRYQHLQKTTWASEVEYKFIPAAP